MLLLPLFLFGLALVEARKAVINKQWQKEQSEKLHGTSTEALPGPWLRTIYGTVKEVVTPYAIGGVTFATRPPETTDSLQYWISLKNDGSPKTIKPKLKNGAVQNGYPDVGTYFQTATTVVHHQQDIQAHNLKEDDTIEEVILAEEDTTYISLSPLMRCTPDFYFKRGIANHDTSEPFCSPHDHEKMRVGRTYFLTWFTRFFENAEKVRVHYAYIKEDARQKGFDRAFQKRDEASTNSETEILEKRGFLNKDIHGNPIKEVSAKLDKVDETTNGEVYGAFYSSEWFDSSRGFFPIEVQKEWLKGDVSRRVLMAIQPDTIDDEDFDLLESSHLYATFQLTESVGKNTKDMRKLRDQTGNDDDFYYVITAIPTIIAIVVFVVYIFFEFNKRNTDFSHIRKPKKSRYGNVGKYDLPIAMTDIHKPGIKKA
ncbi:Psg1 protein [Martiniozyma asiatica (nom. inval.)]|nr:Psg1 protein [Martiniozyma asiatica]